MSLHPTPGGAMVLLTSGIVDERPCDPAWSFPSTTPPFTRRGVEPGTTTHHTVPDTLLSPERSGEAARSSDNLFASR